MDQQDGLALPLILKGDLHTVRIEFLHTGEDMLSGWRYKELQFEIGSSAMASGATPHFHNSMGVATIEIGAKEFMCIGAKPPFDHPHVFLDMGAAGEIICPYCSTLYRHNGKLAHGASAPAEAAWHEAA